MRILLIGGGGVVGTALALRMRDHHRITVLDRRKVSIAGVHSLMADATDHDVLAAHIRGSQAVVHLAAIVPRGDTEARSKQLDAAMRVNVGSVAQALAISVREAVPSFVHISSLSVFREFGTRRIPASAPPDAIAPYGLTKRLAENVCAALADEPTTVTSLRLAFPSRAGDWPQWRSPSADDDAPARSLQLADGTTYPALHPDDLADAVNRALHRRGPYAAIALAHPATIEDESAHRLLGWSPRYFTPQGSSRAQRPHSVPPPAGEVVAPLRSAATARDGG
ncbi:NAD-dependent epimerase/dehydratase family protein [Ruania halotolerans]|uniref:NAD-dependent epimerase/dehydratase family protein n=1 Tax=Ruania halotolerans TaxID=2897773 RepID=UPI001E3DCBED|nr:NAD(P)-dependent oxidoreductase [Ruania halotolerans]UFU07598.1 NAD(P)-dependent oxidoreductase [Ruania halotolerans]